MNFISFSFSPMNAIRSIMPMATAFAVAFSFVFAATASADHHNDYHDSELSCNIYFDTHQVMYGEGAKIYWESHDATHVWIEELGSTSTDGSDTVYPTAWNEYEMVASDKWGNNVYCYATIDVSYNHYEDDEYDEYDYEDKDDHYEKKDKKKDRKDKKRDRKKDKYEDDDHDYERKDRDRKKDRKDRKKKRDRNEKYVGHYEEYWDENPHDGDNWYWYKDEYREEWWYESDDKEEYWYKDAHDEVYCYEDKHDPHSPSCDVDEFKYAHEEAHDYDVEDYRHYDSRR